MKVLAIIRIFLKYFLLIFFSLMILGILALFAPALWNRMITYPKLEKERAALWEKYKKPQDRTGRRAVKGVMHSHTYWSHDSRGTITEILDAAQSAGLEFIFLVDHARNKLDTFPRSYHGVYNGIIIEAGTESSSGLMVNPFESTVLDWNMETEQLIHQVAERGGLVTYVHTEKEHIWENPDYHAMEIYNIHTDLLDEKSILPFLLNNIVNGRTYKHWGYRELFDEQTDILSNWDRLNRQRRIVGIGAVDAHNNQSFRARYTKDGRVEWVGSNAKTLTEREANWLDKLLLGETDKFGWAFKWELDPYVESFNFVNNHVFCDTFSNVDIKENIIKGRLFVSFESLAPAEGFQFFATGNQQQCTAIMGDSVVVADVSMLHALSPFPVKFQLLRDGKLVAEASDAYEFGYNILGHKGNYRLVARLFLNDRWLPWVYSNPVYVY